MSESKGSNRRRIDERSAYPAQNNPNNSIAHSLLAIAILLHKINLDLDSIEKKGKRK